MANAEILAKTSIRFKFIDFHFNNFSAKQDQQFVALHREFPHWQGRGKIISDFLGQFIEQQREW